uniref:Uncharacterized protein n=1 Tax=viral metagenome TaxID=1070528 RepID=A0A6C0C7Q4_9ZZZZ
MSNITVLLWLLEQNFPIEITQFIACIYKIVKSQRTKPGHIIFDSPCGHRLRNAGYIRIKSFIHPFSKQTYLFCNSLFLRKNMNFSLDYPYLHHIEYPYILKNSNIYTYKCTTCNTYYGQSANESELKLKIMCYCGKLVDDFPCKMCPQKICLVNECSQFVNKKSSILCSDHFRCATCKNILIYEYYEANFGNCDVFVQYYCPLCLNIRCLDDDPGLCEAIHAQNRKHMSYKKIE